MSLLFPNAPLQSLTSSQAHLALTTSLALKFPRNIVPFSAVREYTPTALEQLHSLFEPGESSFVVYENHENSTKTPSPSEPPPAPLWGEFHTKGPFGVVQMVWPEDRPIPEPDLSAPQITTIDPSQAAEMVALTDIAFPGFFRIATNRMGPYYGIRSKTGELVAMVGERMNINSFHELSGLCTHPNHRGKGYAQQLMLHLMHLHKLNGCRTYLHASTPNTRAIQLYQRMGYELLGESQMYQLTKAL